MTNATIIGNIKYVQTRFPIFDTWSWSLLVCILIMFSRLSAFAGEPKGQEPSEELARFISEANQLWQKGDAANGIPKYERLLGKIEKVYGTNSSMAGLILFRIGFLHSMTGDFEKALPYLERSLKLIEPLPDDKENLVTKSNLYWGLGMCYKDLLKHEQAIQSFQQSLHFKEKLLGANDPSLVDILMTVADFHSANYRPLDATPALERALTISEKAFGKESIEVARILASLGNTKEQAGQFESALGYLERSLKLREKILPATDSEVGIALHNIGSLYGARSDYAKAIPFLERGVAVLEKNYKREDLQSAFQLAGALNNLGTARIANGDYDKGVADLQRALAVTESSFGSTSINLVSTLNSLAVAHRRKSNFDRAQRLYERALRILEGAPIYKTRERVDTLNNLAQMLLDTGNEDAALKLFSQSQELGEKYLGTEDVSVAHGLNGLAMIYQKRGDAKKALSFFQRSLAILEGKQSPDAAGVMNNVAVLLAESGETKSAREMLEKALALEEKIFPKQHPTVATTMHNLGGMLAASGDEKGALILFRKSIAATDATLGKDNPDSWTRLETLAAFEVGNGEWAKGLSNLVDAARRRRRYLAAQMFSRSFASVRADETRFMSDGFHSLFRLALGSLSASAAATGAEQLALGKALIEEVETIAARLATDGQPRIQELLAQSENIRNRISALTRSPDVTAWLQERMAWQNSERDKLEKELSDVEQKLTTANESVAQVVREQSLSLRDIAQSVPQDSVFIDFIQYRLYDPTAKTNQWKEQRYAAYLTFPSAKDSAEVVVEHVDLGDAAPINEAVELICKRMSAGQFAAKDLPPAFKRLSDLVYTPLSKHLTNVTHLIICPDGQLSRIPFEALPVGNKFLLEEKTISYVTSGREVVRLAAKTTKTENSKSLVMGNPDFDFDLAKARPSNSATLATETAQLRSLSRDYRGLKFKQLSGAEAEARGVAKLLGNDGLLRLGAAARESELKTAKSPRVLHLATHGFFLSDQEFKQANSPAFNFLQSAKAETQNDWENPMVRCGIALAGANRVQKITNAAEEDGVLTGLEASLLNLHGTELVILSACDSGKGEVKIGEGVMSLRRAFRIAGAQSVLASHWQVSDKATNQLMTEFMRRWQAGEPRAKAWREAQLSLLRSKNFSNPYFCAAFTLTGQWR